MDWLQYVPWIISIVVVVIGYFYIKKAQKNAEKNVLLVLGAYKADNEMLIVTLQRNMMLLDVLTEAQKVEEKAEKTPVIYG